ncbi:hypothetical protein CJ030_MR1G027727 [Morella rubra]|uniref:Uncharacterized protein n=1 Tax=Morella rubra TaxID=262757 RepID=A0A6A1WPG0_9ROSI|nr:hypothetical protein CJ030_MR1G027727 [Morella rubra]
MWVLEAGAGIIFPVATGSAGEGYSPTIPDKEVSVLGAWQAALEFELDQVRQKKKDEGAALSSSYTAGVSPDDDSLVGQALLNEIDVVEAQFGLPPGGSLLGFGNKGDFKAFLGLYKAIPSVEGRLLDQATSTRTFSHKAKGPGRKGKGLWLGPASLGLRNPYLTGGPSGDWRGFY